MTWAEIVVEIKKLTNYTARTGRSEVDIGLLAVLNTLYEYAVAQMGAVDDTAVIDPTADSTFIAALKGLLKQLQGDGTGANPVTLATSLSSEFDTIDVNKMSKGAVTVAHSAITATATSSEIDCRGFNALDIQFEVTAGSGKWNIEITGSATSGGTFANLFAGNMRAKRCGLTANTGFVAPIGIGANYIKIVATEIDNGATVTIRVTPINASISCFPYIRESQTFTDQAASWAASSVIDTQYNVDFVKPDVCCEIYQAIVMNLSRITDVEIDVKALETALVGETRGALITTFNVPKASAVLLQDGETAWTTAQGANVVCTADAAIYKVGAKSAKMMVGDAATTGLLASFSVAATNLSPYTHLWFWLYSSIALNASELAISVDDTAACASPIETIPIPAITATTWTQVTVRIANPIFCAAIISGGINMAVDKGAFDVYIDDLNGFKPGWNTPLITGLFNGVGVRFSQQNSTALGANDAFYTTLRLKEYK